MLKAKTIFILGIWVAILPHLGFPLLIKNFLFLLTGLSFIYVSFLIYKESKYGGIMGGIKKTFDNFSENIDFYDRN